MFCPREKCGESKKKKEERGGGRVEVSLPLPPLFLFLAFAQFSGEQNIENPVPRSLFAFQPHGNACYAIYDLGYTRSLSRHFRIMVSLRPVHVNMFVTVLQIQKRWGIASALFGKVVLGRIFHLEACLIIIESSSASYSPYTRDIRILCSLPSS